MLIVTATETAKIKFTGSSSEIPKVAIRLGFTALQDGKNIIPTVTIYESVDSYKAGRQPIDVTGLDVAYSKNNPVEWNKISLAIPDTNPVKYLPQNIEVIHDKYKALLEEIGLTVEVVGL